MQKIAVSKIQKSARPRALNSDAVEKLAQSMNQIGLHTPITVKPAIFFHQGVECSGFEIVTGRHRLEAARMLGWEEIDAMVMDEDIRTCRLWEISENLHRAELTALERSAMVAEWVELTGVKVGQNVQVCSGGRGHREGISEAARQLPVEGKTDDAKRKNVERAIKVASLSPEAQEKAKEVGLDDNRSALLDAAKEDTPEEQVAVLEEKAKKKRIKVEVAAPIKSDDVVKKQVKALMSAWNKANDAARDEFLNRINEEGKSNG